MKALVASALLAGSAFAQTPRLDDSVISGLGIRNIGSAAMSGRIAALDAARKENGDLVLYIGAASGGVWKSTDLGTTFQPKFDHEPVQSIGAVTIDPSSPDTVWVGTGEAWTRNSVSIGDGVYKTTDGGETWTNMGLKESERITRVAVSPKDSGTVYVCATGKLDFITSVCFDCAFAVPPLAIARAKSISLPGASARSLTAIELAAKLGAVAVVPAWGVSVLASAYTPARRWCDSFQSSFQPPWFLSS